MKFDLEKHLKNHAFLFRKLAPMEQDTIHFNFSYLDLQFLDKNTEETMEALLNALLEPAAYKVANGKRIDKHGNIVQKFTTRKINLQQEVLAMAIHIKGPEGEDTMPHIHFIARSSARFGKGYSLLKRHISVLSESFGLVPNFDEMAEHNPLSVSSLSRSVSRITWSWKHATNAQLKQEIASRGLDKSIDLLTSYTLKTKNLSYYIKSMEGLQNRLNRIKLDVHYQGHPLRDTYPIPLTHEDHTVIDIIKNRQFTQKTMEPYIKTPILRDYIRYSAQTTTPFIINALKKYTSLLSGVRKNRRAVTTYQKLIAKTTPVYKSRLTPQDNLRLTRNNELREIIMENTRCSTDQKSFLAAMQQAGYTDFALIKKTQKVTGCRYIDNGSKREVNFVDLGLRWNKLKEKFAYNIRQKENGVSLPSPSSVKHPPLHAEIARATKRTSTPSTIPIIYKTQQVRDAKQKAQSRSSQWRLHEKLIPKIRRKIRRFESVISELKTRISRFKKQIGALIDIERTHTDLTNAIREEQAEETRLTREVKRYRDVANQEAIARNKTAALERKSQELESKLRTNETTYRNGSLFQSYIDRFEQAIEKETLLHDQLETEIADHKGVSREVQRDTATNEEQIAILAEGIADAQRYQSALRNGDAKRSRIEELREELDAEEGKIAELSLAVEKSKLIIVPSAIKDTGKKKRRGRKM